MVETISSSEVTSLEGLFRWDCKMDQANFPAPELVVMEIGLRWKTFQWNIAVIFFSSGETKLLEGFPPSFRGMNYELFGKYATAVKGW